MESMENKASTVFIDERVRLPLLPKLCMFYTIAVLPSRILHNRWAYLSMPNIIAGLTLSPLNYPCPPRIGGVSIILRIGISSLSILKEALRGR